MPELTAFGLVVAVVAVAGVAIGILVAPALSRWSDRQEEPGDDTIDPD